MNELRIKRVARECGMAVPDVQAVIDAVERLRYPVGTVIRFAPEANMAIKTPDGWAMIPNTTYLTDSERGLDVEIGPRWRVVYNPDEFDWGTAAPVEAGLL